MLEREGDCLDLSPISVPCWLCDPQASHLAPLCLTYLFCEMVLTSVGQSTPATGRYPVLQGERFINILREFNYDQHMMKKDSKVFVFVGFFCQILNNILIIMHCSISCLPYGRSDVFSLDKEMSSCRFLSKILMEWAKYNILQLVFDNYNMQNGTIS